MLGKSKVNGIEEVDAVALRNRCRLPNVRWLTELMREAPHPEASEVVHSNRRNTEGSF
jgi:hypothetical protein